MIEVNETELIEFFETMPEPLSQDEREFFAAPYFRKSIGDLELRFSVSAHFGDLILSLHYAGVSEPILDMRLSQVASVAIDRTRGGRQWLQIASPVHGTLELAVMPTLSVRLNPPAAYS